MANTLKTAVQAALDGLTDDELTVFTLAVLHGLPVRQLMDEGVLSGDGNQAVVGCLKKIRASLAEQNFDPAATRQLLRKRRKG
jgi:DNA-directed RNA polymerase specialized sigma24 family protein